MDSWIADMLDHWFVPVAAFGVGIIVAAGYIVRRALTNRPRARTSAMQRLIARNPAIIFDGARWTVAARRVRTSWVTSLAVATAVRIVADHPLTVGSNRS